MNASGHLPAVCRVNSFVPATLVLMADGTTKPIADVHVGDMVMAADPETGERGPRGVTDTIVGDGVKELVDIEIDGDVVTATDGHPFWVDDEGRWVDAEDLEAGDVLLLADGDTVTIDAVRERTEVRRVHNLTVDGIHTYYVVAGDDPVLVHNCAQPAQMTERAARREAFRRHNVPTSIANNFERVPVYGRNPNLRGPMGQPSEIIRTTDLYGRPVEIPHHSWGHVFDDVSPPMLEGPHYHGPYGEHIFHGF